MNPDNPRQFNVRNRLLLALILVAGLVWAGAVLIGVVRHATRELRVIWQTDGGLRLASVSDGPFVVTHLIKAQTRSEGEKAVATLPQPLAVTDSRGATITPEEFRRLVWRDYVGQVIPPLPSGTPIAALYYSPQTTRPSAP